MLGTHFDVNYDICSLFFVILFYTSLLWVKKIESRAIKSSVLRQLRESKALLSTADENYEALALIIDGKSLTYALEDDVKDLFLELAIGCASVICCRSSPKQKALVSFPSFFFFPFLNLAMYLPFLSLYHSHSHCMLWLELSNIMGKCQPLRIENEIKNYQFSQQYCDWSSTSFFYLLFNLTLFFYAFNYNQLRHTFITLVP